MPLRQTIGISLALVMLTTGALAKAPEKSAEQQASAAGQPQTVRAAKRGGKTRSLHRAAHFRWPSRLRFHRSDHGAAAAEAGAAGSDPDWGPMHTTGYQEFGEAAWYALVGSRTSNGERLDTVTPTAAHRWLPLGSCAKVTNLDTGRSVIVKVNDRGPYNRRFIIDLSPRAAAELCMMHAGVAAVAVEPLAPGPAPARAPTATAAVYHPGGNAAQ